MHYLCMQYNVRMLQGYHVLIDSTPFFGLGEYTWSGAVGTCLPIWAGHTDYVIYFSILSTIPFTIIIVTTVWTYIFTRRFLRKDFRRRKTTMTQTDQDQLKHEKSVYNVRIRNLIGVFGMLLLSGIITFSPYIIATVVGLIIGLENVASEIYTTALILFLLNNVTNSIIQSYFRQDLRECIVQYSMKFAIFCKMHCYRKFYSNYHEKAIPGVILPDGIDKANYTLHKSNKVESDINRLSVNVTESLSEQRTIAVASTETLNTDINGQDSASQSVSSLQVIGKEHSHQNSISNHEPQTNATTANYSHHN